MNKPLGGKLVDRIAGAKVKRSLAKLRLPTIVVPLERQIEAWNIATGAYSPLKGFMGSKDVRSVLGKLQVAGGVFWPIPIVLDIDAGEKKKIGNGKNVFLAGPQGEKFAVATVREIYAYPKKLFEKKVFGTNDPSHPGVARTRAAKPYLVGCDIAWIGKPLGTTKPSFTPAQTRKMFAQRKWRRIVAFHTRNVPHLGHEHVQREGLKRTDGLLVQPLIGRKKSGDFRNEVVANAYRYFVKRVLPEGKAILSFLPYSAYYAGPREALLTAVIRKNFGCTHFIVGRDHTGVGDFYGVKDYARMIQKYSKQMGIEIFHFGAAFYCTRCKDVRFDETCPHGEKYRIHPSGTTIRKMLVEGKIPPKEMMRPDIAKMLLKEKELFVK